MVTKARRALPVCEQPALGMPWGTARSNAASAVCSRGGGACTGGCGRGAVQVVCGGCGFVSLWRVPKEEAALGNHSAQSPTSAALDIPRGTARENAASAVCSRGGGACTRAAAGLGRWFVGVAVLPVCGDFHPEDEAALGNHSTQSPASV